jgi:2-keto-4-pentenoate hydratase
MKHKWGSPLVHNKNAAQCVAGITHCIDNKPTDEPMPLDTAAIAEGAERLAEARRATKAMAALPESCRPATKSEGYAIQDAFRALWDDRVVGWKIGATAKPVQEKFGTDEPFAGPFFAKNTLNSPARTPAIAYVHRAIESEFAFRFGTALPHRSAAYTRQEIFAAIDALVPAIEIVGPRFEDLLFGRAPTAIADCAVNAGFVVGTPVTAWRDVDLVSHPVRLHVDGKLAAEGTGAAVLGNPLVVLEWAVEHLRQRHITIEAGQLISTGTTTGIVHLEPGQTAVADFGALGQVSITMTA